MSEINNRQQSEAGIHTLFAININSQEMLVVMAPRDHRVI